MRAVLIVVFVLVSAVGCSFYNFFGYEEDTGLYVIERPEGYLNAKFGAELAATSTSENDLLAVSAGRGHPTIFYRLAADGDLVNVKDPWKKYLADDEKVEADEKGSGTSLVGLPEWGKSSTGCVAIGEPEANMVTIDCEPGNEKETLAPAGSPKEFGQRLAGIRPAEGERWLLVVAEDEDMWVYSDHDNSEHNRSETFMARAAGGARAGTVYELVGGRFEDRFFVAATAYEKNQDRYQTYLFIQSAENSRGVEQVACIEQKDEPGFGGVMATGDLNADGNDELILSAAQVSDRAQKVYVYDIAELLPASDDPNPVNTCGGDPPEPIATLTPGEGDLDVDCEDGCDFGTALAVGDIATDDNGAELIVGAPGAKVDGKGEAGAAFIFHGEKVYDGDVEVAGQVADSAPEKGHRFGGGLTVAPMAGRNELIVGVTGKGQVVVAFCTGVGTDLKEGGDLTTNASGSVISTRCRP